MAYIPSEQINDFFWSKVAVKEARNELIFTQLGEKLTQRRNFGDTLKKYHKFPIIHPSNINDEGIDGLGVKMVPGKWYRYAADGVTRIAEYDTKEDAKAALQAGEILKSGDGNLYGGSKDFLVQVGSFPTLREEGGKVNRVGMKKEILEAKVEEFGMAATFTKKEIEMSSEMGVVKEKALELGKTFGTLREAQVRASLLTAGLNNTTYAGSATQDSEVDENAVVTYSTLRQLKKSLDDALCPNDTKIVAGSKNYGTTTVGAARYIYVGPELVPTLEDMTVNIGGTERPVWKPVEDYAAGTTVAKGEIGKIGNFRFVLVQDMPYWEGAGANNDEDDDDKPDAAGYYETNEHFDIFPMLVVGSGSFASIGFEGDIARVQTAMPKVDANSDWYGKNGVVSISWYYGFMALHPEWIRVVKTAAKIG